MIEGLPTKGAPEVNVLREGMKKKSFQHCSVSSLHIFGQIVAKCLSQVWIQMQFYCCRISSKSKFQSLRFRYNYESDDIMVSVARTFD